MRLLLATTCLTAMISAAPAAAETVVSTAVTNNLLTGTNNDDLRISSTGSVKPTSGAAVTINSNDKVTNEGTIQITGSNGAVGILANTNLAGDIVNTGTITIDEAYTPTDTDNDGDLDGPFAQGTNRFGIHVLGGGTYTGTITNSGTITVEGNSSAGIAVDSALTGSIRNSGNIGVTGDNSVGLRADAVSGDVIISKGTIAVKGANSVGIQLNGNVGGAFVLQGSVASTGYRNTTAPSDTSKLDADDLLQGGSAVVVGGNVAGGVLFDAAPKDTNPNNADEDADGVPDAQETTASITTFGSAPAVAIGSASQSVTLGTVGSTGRGLVNRGTIAALGVYKGVSSTAISIGGLGQAVTVTGGMVNSGSVGASAIEGNATAIRLGSGASAAILENGGTLNAVGGGTATTGSTTVLIEAGASLPTLRNTGTLTASLSGPVGTASAIVDQSGTLSLVENSGVIRATGVAGKIVAFDLSANGSGATVRQLAVTSGSAPEITGDMLFGSGNDTLDVADGRVTGAAKFGAGSNTLSLSGDAVMNGAVTFGAGGDSVQLAGTSQLIGNIDFGGGADSLGLAGTALYRGQLLNSGGAAVTVGTGATLDVTNIGTVDLASLSVNSGGTLGVTIGSTGHTLFNVGGTATFGTGANLAVTLTKVGNVAGTYTIVDAGTVTGGADLATSVGSLPFLYDSSISTAVPGEVQLILRQKSADELGLNRSEGAILPALLEVADSDSAIASVLLGIDDSETLRDTLQQMLPEHAGGAFENATKGTRLATRLLLDPITPTLEAGRMSLWGGQVAWGSSKGIGQTSSYKLGGWGAILGTELAFGPNFAGGATLAYYSGRDRKRENELAANEFEGGLYLRAGTGPLRGFARVAAARIKFDGERNFEGLQNGNTVTRTANAEWNGTTLSGAVGATYDLRIGRFSLRPAAQVEYLRLKEKGYSEKGGGSAFNLTVDGRTSNETAALGTIAAGYDLIGDPQSDTKMRIELEGGYRSILSGKLGETTARFGQSGTPFTLEPEQRDSGFVGALRVFGGGTAAMLGGEINAEQQQGRVAVGAKASISLAL